MSNTVACLVFGFTALGLFKNSQQQCLRACSKATISSRHRCTLLGWQNDSAPPDYHAKFVEHENLCIADLYLLKITMMQIWQHE